MSLLTWWVFVGLSVAYIAVLCFQRHKDSKLHAGVELLFHVTRWGSILRRRCLTSATKAQLSSWRPNASPKSSFLPFLRVHALHCRVAILVSILSYARKELTRVIFLFYVFRVALKHFPLVSLILYVAILRITWESLWCNCADRLANFRFTSGGFWKLSWHINWPTGAF